MCFAWIMPACSAEKNVLWRSNLLAVAKHSFYLLQQMANTTLTAYVGLTPGDAELMFDKLVDVQPHWNGRWGLKATPVEAIAITF